jgi:hypothetical protein
MVPFVAIIPDLQTNVCQLHVHCRSAPDTSKTRTARPCPSVFLPSPDLCFPKNKIKWKKEMKCCLSSSHSRPRNDMCLLFFTAYYVPKHKRKQIMLCTNSTAGDRMRASYFRKYAQNCCMLPRAIRVLNPSSSTKTS